MFHHSGQLKRTATALLAGVAAFAATAAAPAFAKVAPKRHPSYSRCSSVASRAHRRARQSARGCTPAIHRSSATHAHKPRRPRVKTVLHRHSSTASGQVPSAASTAIPTVAAPAVTAAATIASVLATPCENTELIPSAADLQLVRSATLCLINRERAENGVAPLRTNPELEAAAEEHCSEMIADDYFAHVAPSGETPVQRIEQTGYVPSPSDGYVLGENLAWGTYELSTPQAIVSAWIASPEHLANMLESKYQETGIGVTPAVASSVADGAPGATYAEEFGVIIP